MKRKAVTRSRYIGEDISLGEEDSLIVFCFALRTSQQWFWEGVHKHVR